MPRLSRICARPVVIESAKPDPVAASASMPSSSSSRVNVTWESSLSRQSPATASRTSPFSGIGPNTASSVTWIDSQDSATATALPGATPVTRATTRTRSRARATASASPRPASPGADWRSITRSTSSAPRSAANAISSESRDARAESSVPVTLISTASSPSANAGKARSRSAAAMWGIGDLMSLEGAFY